MIHMIGLFFSFAVGLERGTVTFSNGKKISVEIARSAEDKAKGLMFRTRLDKDTGMLFVFTEEQRLSFWMKNTYIPLTIGFFDANKKLLETHDMVPHVGPVSESQLPQYASSAPALYALEAEQGWFAQNKIAPGLTFKLKINP